jgi:hypothetical protein
MSNIKLGWIQGFLEEIEEDDDDKRIVDYFGIANYTEKLADKILPNINTRYHSIKYYFLIIIGIDIITKYLKSKFNKEKENAYDRAEIYESSFKNYLEKNFDNYMQYFEYRVARLLNDQGEKSFIGINYIKKYNKFLKLKQIEKSKILVRKHFLKRKISYAYDRYKTSLERIKWINDDYEYDEKSGSILTTEGKKILKLIKENKRNLYDELQETFENENKTEKNKLKIKFNKKIYKKLKDCLFENQISKKIYKEISNYPNNENLIKYLPNNKNLQNDERKTIKEIEAIYNSFKPLEDILQKIKGKKKKKINLDELEKDVKNINIKSNIKDNIENINDSDIEEFLKKLKKSSNLKEILERINERIEEKKHIRIFKEIKKDSIKIEKKIIDKFFKRDGFKPTNFRLDVAKRFVEEYKKCKK